MMSSFEGMDWRFSSTITPALCLAKFRFKPTTKVPEIPSVFKPSQTRISMSESKLTHTVRIRKNISQIVAAHHFLILNSFQ